MSPYKDPEKRRKYNKEYQKEYSPKYYKKNKEMLKQKKEKRRKKMREWIQNLTSTLKCSKCNENRSYCLDFHHINPKQKKFNIKNSIGGGYGKKRILEEIDKCIVLCANCHRTLHYWELV